MSDSDEKKELSGSSPQPAPPSDGEGRVDSAADALTWQAVPERGRQPALDIYLHSSFNRQFDLANDIELSHWSAAVGIELFWGQY